MNQAEDRTGNEDVEGVLRQTRADFVGAFQATYAAMARLIDVLQQDTNGNFRQELERLVHRLGGLAGTIGFPTVSARARDLEDLLRDTAPDQLEASHAHRLLEAIQLGFEQDASE
jgi:HPt (histidine-containing phosphotransfer) domain-containing protein